MANVLLTTRCVRSCPYCFAQKEITGEAPDELLGWEDLIYVAGFLQASDQRHISLLGGEPTLHPDFVDFVLYLIERRFHVTVFTSGIMSPRRLEELDRHLTPVALDRLQFVCNLNDPQQTSAPEGETRRIHDFLRVMGPWTGPGFNIYREDFSLDFLVDLVNRFGMRRRLRLGISHPVPGHDEGEHLAPEQVKRVLERLYAHRELLDRARVRPGFDCGFPLCGITDEQLGWLTRRVGSTHFGCGPAIDIAPDLSVYACFPLSTYHRRSLLDFDTFEDVVAYFRGLHERLRIEVPGIHDECELCVAREDKLCAGGGICHVLCKLAAEAPVRLPEVEDGLPRAGLPV